MTSFPEDLRWALSVLAEVTPEAARAAEVWLARALADVPLELRFSRLTGDGFPVELVLAEDSDAVRFTTEVGGLETPPEARLRAAERLLERYGIAAPDTGVVAALQAAGAPIFGAWLGARIEVPARAPRFKLYAEVPEGVDPRALIRRTLGGPPLDGRATQLRMIGFPAEIGAARELYFRVEGLERWELEAICRRFGVDPALAGEVVRCLETLRDRPLEDGRLPGLRQGFSVAGRAVSLFVPAARFGSDARLRAALLAAADGSKRSCEAYRRVSRAAVDRRDARTDHGLVSFVMSGEPGGEGIRVAVGLRPRAPRKAAPGGS